MGFGLADVYFLEDGWNTVLRRRRRHRMENTALMCGWKCRCPLEPLVAEGLSYQKTHTIWLVMGGSL